MHTDQPEMTPTDVIEIVELLEQHGITVVIDGGWGVDALLGRQTRKHEDLDVAVEHKDVPRIRALLKARGYRDVPRDDTRECNFVLGDEQGHLVDVHSYTFDEAGRIVFGVEYPCDSLRGTGVINGRPVKTITPEWMVRFHRGYELDANDYEDVKLLCQRFGFRIPEDYDEGVEDAQQPYASFREPERHKADRAVLGYGGVVAEAGERMPEQSSGADSGGGSGRLPGIDRKRETRCQGAIIRDDHILLIRQRERATARSYWLLPGGGRESHETEEACVRREMQEETGLDVSIGRLLLDETPIGVYRRNMTYLCEVVSGNAEPGYEPEADAAWYDIVEVRWFDLQDSAAWDDCLRDDPIIFPLLQRIRAVLGYA